MHCCYHSRLIAVIVFAVIGWACKNSIEVNEDENSTKALVVIQLEGDFLNDSVRVGFDSQDLLVGRVRTNYSISLAWSSDVFTVPAGVHSVRISVFTSNTVDWIYPILQDTMTVTANYERQSGQLVFRTYDYLILRD